MVNITDVRNLNMTSERVEQNKIRSNIRNVFLVNPMEGLDECGACPGIGKGCSWTGK